MKNMCPYNVIICKKFSLILYFLFLCSIQKNIKKHQKTLSDPASVTFEVKGNFMKNMWPHKEQNWVINESARGVLELKYISLPVFM